MKNLRPEAGQAAITQPRPKVSFTIFAPALDESVGQSLLLANPRNMAFAINMPEAQTIMNDPDATVAVAKQLETAD